MIDVKNIVNQVLNEKVEKINNASTNKIPEFVLRLTSSMLLEVLEQYDHQLEKHLTSHSEETQ